MINRWFLELKIASIGDYRVFFVFFCNFGTFWNASSLRRRAELSNDEEPLYGSRKLGRRPVGKESETSPTESSVRIAPVCKEPPAARAQGLRHQRKSRRGQPGFGVTRSEQEPSGTCQRAENIIGTVESARRGALVRQVSLAEKPAESAVRKAPVCKEPLTAQARGLHG